MDTEGVKVQLTTEQALLTDAGTLIDSWFVQQAETGHFAGRDDVQIAYARVLYMLIIRSFIKKNKYII